MLVLSRHVNERIVIDERITITVVGIKGDKVKIGIEAPVDVNVRREELPPLTASQSLPEGAAP